MPPIHWSIPDIADALHGGLERASTALELAQEVRGLDARDELELHPLIQDVLREAGFGVHPEQRYPADRLHQKRSEGGRCDIVLTPDGRALQEPDIEATLFTPADAVALSDAFWLEIKVIAQFTEAGPNARYAADLQEPVRRDVAKLARDPGIRHAALCLLLFCADDDVAAHDLREWERRCMARDLPIGIPCTRRTTIGNRYGNTVCVMALYHVRA